VKFSNTIQLSPNFIHSASHDIKSTHTRLAVEMKNKKIHTVGIVRKSNRNIIERGKIDTPST